MSWRDEYFYYLCEKVGCDPMHREFLKVLHGMVFTWEGKNGVANDANREAKGRMLRLHWWDREDSSPKGLYPYELINTRGSFLEVLVGIADDMEMLMANPMTGDRTRIWFWMLIDNIGLGWVKDELLDNVVRLEIQKTVKRVCDRTYSKNGEGGLFPLKHPSEDCRKTEIWYQMQQFVHESLRDSDGYYV